MKWKLAESVKINCNEDSATLLDKRTGEYYVLSGAYRLLIKEFFEGNKEINFIISKYVKLFQNKCNENIEEILKDVIHDFREKRWIEYEKPMDN